MYKIKISLVAVSAIILSILSGIFLPGWLAVISSTIIGLCMGYLISKINENYWNKYYGLKD